MEDGRSAAKDGERLTDTSQGLWQGLRAPSPVVFHCKITSLHSNTFEMHIHKRNLEALVQALQNMCIEALHKNIKSLQAEVKHNIYDLGPGSETGLNEMSDLICCDFRETQSFRFHKARSA